MTVLTAIGVDRLLALTLRIRYRQMVTVKRARWAVLVFWIKSGMIGALHLCQPDLTFYSTCFTNTFGCRFNLKLFVHKNIFRNPKTTSASSSFSPNREQYTKYGTLQTVNFQCIMGSFDSAGLLPTPFAVVTAVIVVRGSSTLLTMAQFSTLSLVYMNSSLNPAFYYRQAVKQTIRQLLHCISFYIPNASSKRITREH